MLGCRLFVESRLSSHSFSRLTHFSTRLILWLDIMTHIVVRYSFSFTAVTVSVPWGRLGNVFSRATESLQNGSGIVIGRDASCSYIYKVPAGSKILHFVWVILLSSVCVPRYRPCRWVTRVDQRLPCPSSNIFDEFVWRRSTER